MGIRFFCPNGHPLNVKEELAGKVGFCSKCDVRMRIPLKSQRVSGQEYVPGVTETAEALPQRPPIPSSTTRESASSEKVETTVQNERENNSRPGELIRDIAESIASGGTDGIASGETLGEGSSDNSFLWYVHSGDSQYGPAGTDLIREWIGQGRIAPNTLIWRADWSSGWREAKEVFPEVKVRFEGREENKSNAKTPILELEERGIKGGAADEERLKRRSKKVSMQIGAICLLSAVCLFLIIALIAILFRRGNPDVGMLEPVEGTRIVLACNLPDRG